LLAVGADMKKPTIDDLKKELAAANKRIEITS